MGKRCARVKLGTFHRLQPLRPRRNQEDNSDQETMRWLVGHLMQPLPHGEGQDPHNRALDDA